MDKKYSKEFGKKEKVLNYACQTYQLSRPRKVGAVMALIRQCQPATIEEWEDWYFKHAYTEGKISSKITKENLEELGNRLYEIITTIVIPEWEEAFRLLTSQDCIDYIHNLTINRTFDGTSVKNRWSTMVLRRCSQLCASRKVRLNLTTLAMLITWGMWGNMLLDYK
jgi:MjaI restriction endonuclease